MLTKSPNRPTGGATAPRYDEADKKGFQFEFLKTSTYWSTLESMKLLLIHVLVPYFENVKRELGLPANQKCLWQINVWTVHRSKEFRDWVKETFPWIIVHNVPANCTRVFQACDVGIQRVLKHSLKQSYHKDIVSDMSGQMDRGEELVIEKKLGVLRDRAVAWLVRAHDDVNRIDIVKKVSS